MAAETRPASLYAAPTSIDRIGRIMAPVMVNGQGPFRFIVDTGASRSAISPSLAERLGLVPSVEDSLTVQGVTGSDQVPSVMIDRLQAGEMLKVDTGCVVAYTPGIDFDIEFIRGIKNWMFGGEGLFFAKMQGPGKVWLQSLPISRLAGRIIQYGTYKRKEEGGILGGLGNLLDGRE